MLTEQQKQVIKATIPVLRESGLALTTYFYQRMFTHNPELKNIFNMGNQQKGKQQMSLAMAVLAYAENIDHPEVLMSRVNTIGHKHTSLNIRPEHYILVGNHLIASIQEVLGEAATTAIVDAWTAAYNQLAAIMSGHEAKLYQDQLNKEGGWKGWRPFIIKEKIKESEEITSFYLYPSDGKAIADFQPGQYISVRAFIPALQLLQPRQYSISSAPGKAYYRISVKKENASATTPEGMVSNYLHDGLSVGDVLDVSAPAGDFVLQNNEKPVVFISGGVGQTPLLSMAESLVEVNNDRRKVWVHGCRNKDVHAFAQTVDSWEANDEKFQKHIFYHQTQETDLENGVNSGILELNHIQQDVLLPEADFYLCGPAAFIEKNYQDLLNNGIKKEQIFYEEFGPAVINVNS